MNPRSLAHTLLLVFGIIGLAKSVVGVAFPQVFQRFAAWWVNKVRGVHVVLGAVSVVLAVLIWGVVLMHQPLANWILLVIGMFFAWAATVYFSPATFDKLARAFILDRHPAVLRIVSLATGAVAVLLIWVAIKRL